MQLRIILLTNKSEIMELLDTYLIERTDTENYTVEFKIPDNCSHSFVIKGSLTKIKIQLKTGETAPSSNLHTYNINVTAHNNLIEIEFLQQDWENNMSTFVKRPKVRIDIIGA